MKKYLIRIKSHPQFFTGAELIVAKHPQGEGWMYTCPQNLSRIHITNSQAEESASLILGSRDVKLLAFKLLSWYKKEVVAAYTRRKAEEAHTVAGKDSISAIAHDRMTGADMLAKSIEKHYPIELKEWKVTDFQSLFKD